MDASLNEYDSDDSLPPISELCPLPTEFMEGEIVWAKYKKFYWPSLIRKVYKKDKKVSLWYLDSVSKTFKVAFKNLHRFNDRDFGTEVKKAVSASPLKSLHDRVLEATMDYVYRRSDGIQDDPVEFFTQNVPKQSLSEVLASAKQARKVDATVSESLQKSLGEKFVDSDEESVTDSEEDEEKRKERIEELAELALTEEDYCPEPRVNAMVECITTGHVNQHLIGIISRKVPCVRQQKFEEFVRESKSVVWPGNSFPVHIKDDTKVKAIFDYLESFYEQTVAKGKWSMFKYVTNVWMPEAMTEALRLVDNGWKPGPIPSAKRKLFKIEEINSVDEEKDSSVSVKNLRKAKTTSRKPKTTSKKSKSASKKPKTTSRNPKVKKFNSDPKTELRKSPRNKKSKSLEQEIQT